MILTEATSGPPEEAIRLAEGDHPFVDLLTLIEEGDTLSDDDWARLHTSVGAAFGVPLARAAARGRLVLTTPTGHPGKSPEFVGSSSI